MAQKKVMVENDPVLVPPYPESSVEDGTKQFTEIPAGQQQDQQQDQQIVIDTKQISYDLVDMAGKIWHVINPRVRVFEKNEIKNIAEPLTAVIEKHDLTRYMKYFGYTQEMLLIYNTFNVVAPRIKELKEPVIHTIDGTPEDLV